MHQVIGTDSNGGVLYRVWKRTRKPARYERGQAAATESTRSSGAAQRRRKGQGDEPATGDAPAGRESGERAPDISDTGWPGPLGPGDTF